MPATRTAAITVLEGSDQMLVGYPGWHAWRRERERPPLPPVPLVPACSASCAVCWGNGRIFEQAANGEGLIPVSCESCDGWGTVSTSRSTPE
jgi:hypothetical protein